MESPASRTSEEAPVVFAQTVQSTFTALGRAFTTDEKSRLRALGVDVDRPLEPAYPAEIYGRVLEFVAAARSPGLAPDEGLRELGERFFDGYTETLMGKAMGQVLKLIGVRRSLARMERNFRNGNNYLASRLEDLGKGKVRLHFENAFESPHYLRGVVESGARFVGAKDFKAELVLHEGQTYAFDVTWDER